MTAAAVLAAVACRPPIAPALAVLAANRCLLDAFNQQLLQDTVSRAGGLHPLLTAAAADCAQLDRSQFKQRTCIVAALSSEGHSWNTVAVTLKRDVVSIKTGYRLLRMHTMPLPAGSARLLRKLLTTCCCCCCCC
jgi:hypothetical protein